MLPETDAQLVDAYEERELGRQTRRGPGTPPPTAPPGYRPRATLVRAHNRAAPAPVSVAPAPVLHPMHAAAKARARSAAKGHTRRGRAATPPDS